MNPRQILAGTTYLITRRTTQRLFLLRPSHELNECIRYCLAIAQRRSGVHVHCVIFMSNHYHLVVTDYTGSLPLFTEELNKLTGAALNIHHGRSENFWAGGVQVSQVQLASPATILKEIVYALANPTKAGLVSHGNKWPGVRLYRQGDYLAKKPKFFFRQEENGGKLPDKLMLTLTPPPIGVPAHQADDVVKKAVSAHEKELRDKAKTSRRKFMGAAAVKRQRTDASPNNTEPRRKISPRVACLDIIRRIEILEQLAQFVAEHKERRKEFIAGVKDVLFPVGTYKIVKQYGAHCAES